MIQLVEHICVERLELYALNGLAQSEVGAVEEHLLLCARCQLALQGLDEEIRQIRAALRRLAETGTTAPIALKWVAAQVNAENLGSRSQLATYSAKFSFRPRFDETKLGVR
jgi:hypothetical protein